MKTFALPFTESKIGSLTLLDTQLQKLVLDTRSQIEMLNSDIENADFYFKMTFDSNLAENNRRIVEVTLNEIYPQIARKSKLIVEAIENLISKYPDR